MVIFHSYVSLPEGNVELKYPISRKLIIKWPPYKARKKLATQWWEMMAALSEKNRSCCCDWRLGLPREPCHTWHDTLNTLMVRWLMRDSPRLPQTTTMTGNDVMFSSTHRSGDFEDDSWLALPLNDLSLFQQSLDDGNRNASVCAWTLLPWM